MLFFYIETATTVIFTLSLHDALPIWLLVGIAALAELLVFVADANWIGLAWTILLARATTALGFVLLARQGARTLVDLRERARKIGRAHVCTPVTPISRMPSSA